MQRAAPDPLVLRIAERQRRARARADRLREHARELAGRLYALGAERVVLFGSLATGADPHEGTDVDLAVEGLSESVFSEVALELEVTACAKVDLVRLESASPRLRRRVAQDGIEIDVAV